MKKWVSDVYIWILKYNHPTDVLFVVENDFIGWMVIPLGMPNGAMELGFFIERLGNGSLD